jgi:FtsZ-binding cell division protein ZapB
MSIWNKILVGLVLAVSLALIFFAARTLKTHAAWGEVVAKYEAAIKAANEKGDKLREGDGQEPGVEQLRMEMENWASTRSRIWSGCSPGPIGQRGEVAVTIESPDPHQIAPKTVLYVFDDNDVAAKGGGRYLGKFSVVQVAPRQAQLQPATPMDDADLARLKQAKAPWSLCENLPLDNREVFAAWDDPAKKAALPASTVDDYLRDGKAAKPDAEPAERRLRDYRTLFDTYDRRRVEFLARIQDARQNIEYLQATVAGQKEQKVFMERSLAALQAEKAALDAERKVLADHRTALAGKLDEVTGEVKKLTQQTQEDAVELSRIQLEAARRIEERTRGMAQAAASNHGS